MTFYSGSVMLTELMMIAMILHVLYYSGFTKSQKAWFISTFAAIMLCAGAEFAVHSGYYDQSFAVPLTILTVLQFSVAPVLPFMFSGALGLSRQSKYAIIFFIVCFLTEIISLPFGWIFSFGQNGYSRGDYFFIYEIFYFSGLIYLIISMILVGKKFSHRDSRTIISIIVILAAGIVPMTFYKLNIAYTAVAISSILCYVYYNDLVQQNIQSELVVNQKKISDMQNHIISSLSSLIENRDTETGEHVLRTSKFTENLARFAAKDGVYSNIIDEDFIHKMRTLAPMHDIGKIIVSDKILRKPGPLTEQEFEQMKTHASSGGKVIREILSGVADEEYLSFAVDIASCHHEKWDGSGYPKGLSGNDIPLSARIMTVADVYDALVSERCYKKAIPKDEAVKIIKNGAGSHFDPLLVEVFMRHKKELYYGEN